MSYTVATMELTLMMVSVRFASIPFLTFEPIVPSAPRDFMLLMVPGSSTTLSASWVEPVNTNVTVANYSISCTAASGMVSFSFNDSVTSATLESLTPFTSYTCVISASSDAGEGNCSDSVTAMTDEGCKFVM